MIGCCIFDLDGVIVDTARYHYLAWRRLAGELGFDFTEGDNEALKGVGRMVSLDIMLTAGGMQNDFTTEQKAKMAARKNGWYIEFISAMTPDEILPGAMAFLTVLRAAGIKTALGSASCNARLILRRVGLAPMFDAIVDGDMVSAAKPDPEVFLLGARLTGTDPAYCVVFEDAEAGIEAAARAGMRSVGIGASPTLAKATMRIDSFEGFTIEKLQKIDQI